jgi:hypothetical protein
MSYGIELFNVNNHRVINDYSYNLHYVGRYTTTTNYGGTSYPVAQYLISKTVCPSEPFIFMESTPNGSMVWMVRDDPANNRWIVGVLYNGTRPAILVFSTLTANSTPQENYGMAIYNSGGALVFDSSRKPLKIKYIGQSFVGGGAWQSFPTNVYTVRSYSTGVQVARPAFFIGSNCFSRVYTPINTTNPMLYLGQMSANDQLFRINGWIINRFDAGAPGGDRAAGNVATLIIDAAEFDY